MKLRLKAPSVCRQDFDIWDTVLSRCRPMRLETMSTEQDARDAALMRELVELRSIGAYANVRQLQTMAGEDGCSVGGWMRHYRWVSDKW